MSGADDGAEVPELDDEWPEEEGPTLTPQAEDRRRLSQTALLAAREIWKRTCPGQGLTRPPGSWPEAKRTRYLVEQMATQAGYAGAFPDLVALARALERGHRSGFLGWGYAAFGAGLSIGADRADAALQRALKSREERRQAALAEEAEAEGNRKRRWAESMAATQEARDAPLKAFVRDLLDRAPGLSNMAVQKQWLDKTKPGWTTSSNAIAQKVARWKREWAAVKSSDPSLDQ